MTPISPHTATILRHDLAAVLESVRIVCAGEHRHVYALTTEPGHHSSHSSYGGYCFINFASLAARMLRDQFQKVALVDVDYHAGNGSMSIFWSDPSVFVASIHAHPDIEYPYCFGWRDQRGAEGDAFDTKLNVPLGKGATWAEYKPALQEVCDRVRAFGARALVVSLGVDTVRGDPEAAPMAGFALVQRDYAEMGAMLRELGLPTIVIQEGRWPACLLHRACPPLAHAHWVTHALCCCVWCCR